MSNYRCEAFNPLTRRMEMADALDDYYGPHQYGVRFADGVVYPEPFVMAQMNKWRKENKDSAE